MNTHPNPLFLRPDWLSLDGEWEFEIADGQHKFLSEYLSSVPFKGSIIVPFSPQSVLSRVNIDKKFHSLWYRRSFYMPKEDLWKSTVINFLGVDYKADLYINGRYCTTHVGAYSAFSVDISSFLHEGVNTITVNALDDNDDAIIPKGLQGKRGFPTFTGIWKSVWLDFAAPCRITALRATAVSAQRAILAQGFVTNVSEGSVLMVELMYDGKSLGQYKYPLKDSFFVKIPVPDPINFWELGNGKLYDVAFTIADKDGTMLDYVFTYSAFRTINIREQVLLVNSMKTVLMQYKDRCFYVDGHFTAPSTESQKQDLVNAMALGFNSVRISGTVADPYYLYYADKLGMLVFVEYPSPIENPSNEYKALWKSEWASIINSLISHPSIACWIPTPDYYGGDVNFIIEMYNYTKTLDNTRLVMDGKLHYKTDIFGLYPNSNSAEEFYTCLFNRRNGGFLSDKEEKKERRKYPNAMTTLQLTGLPYFVETFRCRSPRNDLPLELEDFKKSFITYITTIKASGAIGFCYEALVDLPFEYYGIYKDNRDCKLDNEQQNEIRSKMLI